MKSFDRLFAAVITVLIAVTVAGNVAVLREKDRSPNMYKVSVERVVRALDQGESVSAEDFEGLTFVEEFDPDTESKGEYVVRSAGGKLYRIGYDDSSTTGTKGAAAALTLSMGAVILLTGAVFLHIRRNIIVPFARLSDLPRQLAKGTLTTPLKEHKSRYFGKFIWGLDMLREELERSKQREKERAKNEKTLLLSLSHDIKTPLSAIKLSSKVLAKGIYTDTAKQTETAEGIGRSADEIEDYLGSIISSLSSDFMTFDVREGEFYLSDVIRRITEHYTEKLALFGTELDVGKFSDCLIQGDPDRFEEVLQNLMENAIKYGDGRWIRIGFDEEEDCRMVTVENSGTPLKETEISHVFESFWRGSNAENKPGSGLGLYICRRLMSLMGGDIFAQPGKGSMSITAVCRKVS